MEFGSQFAPSPSVGVSTTTCRGGLVTEAAKVLRQKLRAKEVLKVPGTKVLQLQLLAPSPFSTNS